MAQASGEEFEVSISETSQVRLDGDSVKALLEKLHTEGKVTKEEVQGLYKTISFPVTRFNRKDPSKKAVFEMPDFANATIPGIVDQLGELKETYNRVTKKLEGVLKEKLFVMLLSDGQQLPASTAKVEKTWPEMSYNERLRFIFTQPGRTFDEKFDHFTKAFPGWAATEITAPEEDDDERPEWAR